MFETLKVSFIVIKVFSNQDVSPLQWDLDVDIMEMTVVPSGANVYGTKLLRSVAGAMMTQGRVTGFLRRPDTAPPFVPSCLLSLAWPPSEDCFTDNIGKLVTSWVPHTALPPGIRVGSADKHKLSISLIKPILYHWEVGMYMATQQ